MDNTVENNTKSISYANLYSGLAGEVYQKIYNRNTQKETEYDLGIQREFLAL